MTLDEISQDDVTADVTVRYRLIESVCFEGRVEHGRKPSIAVPNIATTKCLHKARYGDIAVVRVIMARLIGLIYSGTSPGGFAKQPGVNWLCTTAGWARGRS